MQICIVYPVYTNDKIQFIRYISSHLLLLLLLYSFVFASLFVLFCVIVNTVFLQTLALNIPFCMEIYWRVLKTNWCCYYSFCRAFAQMNMEKELIERKKNYYSNNHRIIFYVLLLFLSSLFVLFLPFQCLLAFSCYGNAFARKKNVNASILHYMRNTYSTVMI